VPPCVGVPATFSAQGSAATAIAGAGTSAVFAGKGETLPEYWWCTDHILTYSMALSTLSAGETTLLINTGRQFEEK